jgi:hypothetical protein
VQITLLPPYPELEILEKEKHHIIDQLRPFYDKSPAEEFDE